MMIRRTETTVEARSISGGFLPEALNESELYPAADNGSSSFRLGYGQLFLLVHDAAR